MAQRHGLLEFVEVAAILRDLERVLVFGLLMLSQQVLIALDELTVGFLRAAAVTPQAYRLTGWQAYRLTGLQADRLTGSQAHGLTGLRARVSGAAGRGDAARLQHLYKCAGLLCGTRRLLPLLPQRRNLRLRRTGLQGFGR